MKDRFPPPLDVQMGMAVRNQMGHARESMRVNRKGWTRQQWIDDARRLMGDLDGSVLDLVNGHIIAMLERIDELERQLNADRR